MNQNSGLIKSVSALILAGGSGRRIGANKAMIRLGGRTLIEHAAGRAAGVFADVYISGPESLAGTGYPVVADAQAGVGPLAGILAGLQRAPTQWIMTMPCDSPFVPEAYLRGMAALANDHQVVVPKIGSLYEPLHALYAKTLIPEIEGLIRAGEGKIILLYERTRVLEVSPEMISGWDPAGMAFFNINTSEDLEKAREFLETGLPDSRR